MWRKPLPSWLVLTAATLWPFAPLHAASYRYDTQHSQIIFSISHNGYSRSFGRLHIARGWLRFDAQDWTHAATELDLDMAALDMGDAGWNKAVCKRSLLDCEHYPLAHFVSTGVEHQDDHHGVLHGQLTVHGVTVPVSVAFTFNRAAKTIYGLHTVAGFSATAELDRTRFGVTANAGSIGQHVSVWLELEAIGDNAASPSAKEQP